MPNTAEMRSWKLMKSPIFSLICVYLWHIYPICRIIILFVHNYPICGIVILFVAYLSYLSHLHIYIETDMPASTTLCMPFCQCKLFVVQFIYAIFSQNAMRCRPDGSFQSLQLRKSIFLQIFLVGIFSLAKARKRVCHATKVANKKSIQRTTINKLIAA